MSDEIRQVVYACKRCKTRFRLEWESDEQPPVYMRCPQCGSQNAQRSSKTPNARGQLTPEQMLAALKRAQDKGGPTLDGDSWPINIRSFSGSVNNSGDDERDSE